MFKKGDEVMFFFFNGGVHAGKGIIHKVHTLPVNDLTLIAITTIDISWIGEEILSLEPDEVYPFDNDKYIEMCDTHDYITDKNALHAKEMLRLQKICKGEHHA